MSTSCSSHSDTLLMPHAGPAKTSVLRHLGCPRHSWCASFKHLLLTRLLFVSLTISRCLFSWPLTVKVLLRRIWIKCVPCMAESHKGRQPPICGTPVLSGNVIQRNPPYVVERQSVQRLREGLPVAVKSCWNGLVALKAAPFAKHGIKFRCVALFIQGTIHTQALAEGSSI